MKITKILQDEIWKPIEEVPGYEVSNTGYVRNASTRKIRTPFVSNKGYLRIGFSSLKDVTNKSVHTLVVKAFGKKEDVEALENSTKQINHKDGDKRNNHIDNLEVISSSANVLHAFDQGLRTDNFKAIITDISTGEKTYYRSINTASEFFNTNNDTLTCYVVRSKKYPVYGKYTIEIAAKIKVNSGKKRTVYAYDHIADETLEFVNLYHAMLSTGISHTSYSKELLKEGVDVKYIGGYSFSYLPITNNPYKDVTIDKAKKDRDKIWSKPLKQICNGLMVYNPEDGTIKKYSGPSGIPMLKDVDPKSITTSVKTNRKRNNRPAIMSGIIIASGCSSYDLKTAYTDKQIRASKLGLPIDAKLYEYNDNVFSVKEVVKMFNTTERIARASSMDDLIKRYGKPTELS